ncbi:hypothetical protein RR46_08990 [Papilio xuthus]|uniref:Uncharacterized protein n=1 Tax=Papilio xuthus TaxID=66420 RepID=A0A194PQ09_PAPXU|nr:hypothetical protein RR46_08990 [Papilio xuthus]
MVRYGVQNTNDRIQRRERNRVNRSSSIDDDDEDNDEVDNIQRYLHPINAINTSSISDEFTDDDERERDDIDYLCKNYKINYNSIMQIQSVISTTFRKEDAASLIFTYNSANSNFNPANFNQFMNDLAFTTARYLRNDNNIHNHVIVDSTKLDMKVHSELIERYRNDVTKTGVMLVTDLDEVPSYLAMAFHYYCDEFNPLVKKSAILFTLNMAKCSDPKITHASVEKCLAKKWTIIPKDNIVPLLTRIVNVVIDVTNVI